MIYHIVGLEFRFVKDNFKRATCANSKGKCPSIHEITMKNIDIWPLSWMEYML